MNMENPLLLIVDDFESVQRPYRYLLSLEGFRVDFAINGLEALEKAVELQPDVIFMDLSLPGIDGWETTRRLKADKRTHKIPVVMLTALGLEHESGAVAGAGFDGILSKPCAPKTILAEVNRVLRYSPVRS
jgi:CheY-like chemotaxis protein